VPPKILRRAYKAIRIIPETSQAAIALAAQQPAYAPAVVIMVDVQPLPLAWRPKADRASPALSAFHPLDIFGR
jgi:hypothetical protein